MVTIIFRTDDVGQWGTGKGGNLDPVEIDQNFWNLKAAVEALGSGPQPAEIDTIQVVGSQMTITLTDATVFGPFTLPRASFRWRGDWEATTAYLGNDVVRVTDAGLYLVNYAHTSDSSFDAAYVAPGETEAAYIQMFDADGVVGGGGLIGVTEVPTLTYTATSAAPVQFLSCTNSGGCAVTIDDSLDDFPVGSELQIQQNDLGAVTIAASGATLDPWAGFEAETARQFAVVIAKKVDASTWVLFGDLKRKNPSIDVTGTTFTPLLSFYQDYYRCTNASGCTVTIPAESAEDYPLGHELRFVQRGAADVSLAGAAGVTLNTPSGFNPDTAFVGAVVTVKKIGADEWDLFGDLATV